MRFGAYDGVQRFGASRRVWRAWRRTARIAGFARFLRYAPLYVCPKTYDERRRRRNPRLRRHERSRRRSRHRRSDPGARCHRSWPRTTASRCSRTCPATSRSRPLAEKSTIYAIKPDGTPSAMASFYDENREEVPLEYVSQYLKDAAVAGEDPRFYEHGGVDIAGTVRGALDDGRRRQHAGRFVDHAAVREERAREQRHGEGEDRGRAHRRLGAAHRDLDRPQAQGDALRDHPREEVLEGRDPARLPEHRRVRRHRLRRADRRAVLLQDERARPHAAAGGKPHRDREQPREVPPRLPRERDERRRDRCQRRGRAVRGQQGPPRLHPRRDAQRDEDHAGGVRRRRSRRPCSP